MSIRLVTDSTCDLPEEIIKQYNITVAPTVINVGTESYLDGLSMPRTTFYNSLASFSTPPTTAAPAPGEFHQLYQKLVDEGATHILSIHLSKDLSAFFNSARLGSEGIAVPVSLIDTRSVSMGLGLLVLIAAEMVARGDSAETVADFLQSKTSKTRVYAVADTLDFLRRSGRVSWGAASIGSLLSIKPILEVKDGVAKSFDRVRTHKKVGEKLVTILRDLGPVERIAIIHANAEAYAEEIRVLFQQEFGIQNPLICTIGPAIGTHTGPGMVGFACVMR